MTEKERITILAGYPAHLSWLAIQRGETLPEGSPAPVRLVTYGADLSRANLSDADLSRANLSGANLFGATGIRIAGPVGGDGRMIYGVRHEGGAMIQAGCFWGTVPEVIAAIEARYADGSGLEHHRAAYLAAVAWVGGV